MSKTALKSKKKSIYAIKCKIKVAFFNSSVYEMNLVLGKQYPKHPEKKCNLHSNPFPTIIIAISR